MTSNIDIITDRVVEALLQSRDAGLMSKIQCAMLIDEIYDKVDAVVDQRPATLEEIRWNMGNQQDEK